MNPLETRDQFVIINSQTGGVIARIDFTSADSAIASVTTPDLDAAFYTTITAVDVGSTSYTAVATMDDGATTCSDAANISVTNPGPWWQVIGGDLVAGKSGTGSLNSAVPASCVMPECNPLLIVDNAEGYPGVPSAGLSIVPAGVSSTNWRTPGASYSSTEVHNYAFFEKKAQNAPFTNLTSSNISAVGQLTSGATYGGFYWVKYDGASFAGAPLTISSTLDLGTNKVTLFVKNANLQINDSIRLTNGRGSFVVIADADILVDPTVGGPQEEDTCEAGTCTPDIEGIFFVDGQFMTGTEGPDASGDAQDMQLHIRGSVSGLGIPSGGGAAGTNDGLILERDLRSNARTPAELFEFGPDQYFLFPQLLSPKSIIWREVAP